MAIPDEESLVNCLVKYLRRSRVSQNSNICSWILCLCFRASLICINNCPTRCNTKQSIYFSASSLYMFRVSTTPIIRSTQNCNYSLRYWSATSRQRGQTWPRWREVAAQKIWPAPEAVVTVSCTSDDGCGWHPKHVEWTCRIINKLLCVASRWTSGVPRNFVRGWGFNKLIWGQRTERERGSGGGSPLVRGSGGSCNLVQEISFHIIKFS